MTIPFCDPAACPAAGCDPVLCTGRGVPSNATLFERSRRAIPGGVNSSIRAFRSVGGTPYLVARAEGCFVFDVEGRRLIDLVQSYGAIIAGHAHPAVTEARRPSMPSERTASPSVGVKRWGPSSATMGMTNDPTRCRPARPGGPQVRPPVGSRPA